MGIQILHISQEFNAPVEQVFSTLSDHETFGRLCGISMKRVKDGEGSANGLGSIRKVSVGPLPSFEETITDFKSNEFIEYKITKGSPIKNHVGKLEFSRIKDRTLLNYQIQLESKIPLTTGAIKFALRNGIAKGLKKYAASLG